MEYSDRKVTAAKEAPASFPPRDIYADHTLGQYLSLEEDMLAHYFAEAANREVLAAKEAPAPYLPRDGHHELTPTQALAQDEDAFAHYAGVEANKPREGRS